MMDRLHENRTPLSCSSSYVIHQNMIDTAVVYSAMQSPLVNSSFARTASLQGDLRKSSEFGVKLAADDTIRNGQEK